MVAFVLVPLGSLISLIAFPLGTILDICNLIVYTYMLTLLLDNDVKREWECEGVDQNSTTILIRLLGWRTRFIKTVCG